MELNDKIKKYIFNNSNKIKINSRDIKKNSQKSLLTMLIHLMLYKMY